MPIRKRVAAPPPPQPPRLSLQKFQEGTDDMGAFLEIFEATATAVELPVELISEMLSGWPGHDSSFHAGSRGSGPVRSSEENATFYLTNFG